MLPTALIKPIKQQLALVEVLHDRDLDKGFGEVYMPYALAKKNSLHNLEVMAGSTSFPASRLTVDPRSRKMMRHHITDRMVQLHVTKAIRKAKIIKKKRGVTHSGIHSQHDCLKTEQILETSKNY